MGSELRQTQALQSGRGLSWRGEQDRDANVDLRRLKGTLAGKEWFVPMSWSDRGHD